MALTTEQKLRAVLRAASAAVPAHRFSQSFLLSEWTHIVDAQQRRTWESYRDVSRLGRKTRLKEPQRAQLWDIFARVWAALGERGSTTPAAMYVALARRLTEVRKAPYDFAVIDECQDFPKGTCSMSHARGREITCIFRGSSRCRNFWRICARP